jgi:hypothetical protein
MEVHSSPINKRSMTMKVNKQYILGLLASFIFFANSALATDECPVPSDSNDPNDPSDSMSSEITD